VCLDDCHLLAHIYGQQLRAELPVLARPHAVCVRRAVSKEFALRARLPFWLLRGSAVDAQRCSGSVAAGGREDDARQTNICRRGRATGVPRSAFVLVHLIMALCRDRVRGLRGGWSHDQAPA
jgi:hypothetical protein